MVPSAVRWHFHEIGEREMPRQTTLCILKPDAISRQYTGHILYRLQSGGLKFERMELFQPDAARMEAHYAPHLGKDFYPTLLQFMTSGPVIAMALSGENAVDSLRVMMGHYAPDKRTGGTIRGDYMRANDPVHLNLIHGSESPEEAARELGIWFPDYKA
jgi:nucleoside-diphosphate kinase